MTSPSLEADAPSGIETPVCLLVLDLPQHRTAVKPHVNSRYLRDPGARITARLATFARAWSARLSIGKVGRIDRHADRFRNRRKHRVHQPGSLAKRLATRDHEGVKGADNEREAYREIIRRAKRVRERAAESLRRSRASRKLQGDSANHTASKPRRLRRNG